jgi:hypothetical protein
MKIITLVFITFGFMTCKSLQFDKNPPFKITQASYKSWVGGLPGVHGVNVFISYTSKSEIAFDSIYFRNKAGKLEINTQKGTKYIVGHFNTSSVNSRKDLIFRKDSKKEVGNAPPEKRIPFELKENEAVISYQEAGTTKYYKVSNLKKEASVFYP